MGRRWPTNLLRDPRISIAVIDSDDGDRWVGIIGMAEAVTDQPTAQADIAAMARHYDADEPGTADRLIAERFDPAATDQLPHPRVHRIPRPSR